MRYVKAYKKLGLLDIKFVSGFEELTLQAASEQHINLAL